MGGRRDTSAAMTLSAFQFSDDQAEAFDRVSTLLRHVGVNLEDGLTTPMSGSSIASDGVDWQGGFRQNTFAG